MSKNILDYDSIETPEQVELQRRLAGIGSRFLAGLVDTLWMGLLFIVIFLVFALAAIPTAGKFGALGAWAWAILIILLFIIYWGYFIYFEIRHNGQTPGKKSLQIRVVSEYGGAVAFQGIIIRNLLRVVDGLPGGYIVGGICMFFSKRTQRLGDLAAGTLVVSEEITNYSAKGDSRLGVTLKKGHIALTQEASPQALRATQLTPPEYQALYNYWVRRDQLTLEARQNLLPRLLRPVATRLGEMHLIDTFEKQETWLDTLMEKARHANENTHPSSLGLPEENIS